MVTRPYWDSRDQLSVYDGITYKGMRIVVPPSLQPRMLQLIHESHLGMAMWKQRAWEVMCWPAMNACIENAVRNCSLCTAVQNKQPAEPLNPTQVPDLPFAQVGADLFQFQSRHYLLLLDYYSKFVEVEQLRGLTAPAVIQALKSQFCHYGIPEECRSDNGPQFSSKSFARNSTSTMSQAVHITNSAMEKPKEPFKQ